MAAVQVEAVSTIVKQCELVAATAHTFLVRNAESFKENATFVCVSSFVWATRTKKNGISIGISDNGPSRFFRFVIDGALYLNVAARGAGRIGAQTTGG